MFVYLFMLEEKIISSQPLRSRQHCLAMIKNSPTFLNLHSLLWQDEWNRLKMCYWLNETVSLGDTGIMCPHTGSHIIPKCQDLSKSAFWRGGGGVGGPDQSAKICRNLHWGGAHTNIPQMLGGGGLSSNFEPKILATGMCSASQIVSHTLRVWRLINRAHPLIILCPWYM